MSVRNVIANKLAEFEAKNSGGGYVHPATHPPSIIVQDSSNRFTTDAEKTTWNNKANGTHTHVISDVTNLQTSLDGKAPTSHAHPLSQLTQSGATTNQVVTWNGEAWVASTPAGGGGGDPDWYGKIYGGYGRCDAQQLLRMATMAGSVAATPTNIGTGVARIAYFRPPANIVLNKIRYFGVGATTNVYRVAIYDGDSQARLTAELPITTTAQQFGSVGDNMGLTLVKDQLYFMAVGVNAVGTTAGLLCMSATTAATTGQMQVLPKSWPGNLDIDLGFMDGAFAYFTTTNGALPTTAGTILAPLPWTGGFPLFFLDNNNA
jgi:hypothetical protein